MPSLSVPYLSADQMREVDRLAIDEFGITPFQMMENAGRALARVAREHLLGGRPEGKRVLVLVGPGGNGGGGLVCARNLHNWGADVRVVASAPAEGLGEVPRRQLAMLEAMGVTATVAASAVELPDADLVVDALIGYSLRGAPQGAAGALVRESNRHPAPTLSLDVPTGVDATTGAVAGSAVRAAVKMTLALPKEGLRASEARGHVGELYLADIGIPRELYARPSLGVEVGPIFALSDILRLR